MESNLLRLLLLLLLASIRLMLMVCLWLQLAALRHAEACPGRASWPDPTKQPSCSLQVARKQHLWLLHSASNPQVVSAHLQGPARMGRGGGGY